MNTVLHEKQDIRVLVVDDESYNRRLFTRILAAEGYVVETANSGDQALSMLEQAPCNVVVTDLKMPEMNGTELMKRVKEESPSTEIIVVTGHATEESAVEAVRAHAFDYLHKPLPNFSVLLESVRGAVEKQSRLHEIEHKSRNELMELNQQLDLRNKELEDSNNALKNMQSQLLQQEKMAAIGQLAAGVAHEINNPIGFIHSNLGTLKRYVERIVKYNDQCEGLIQLCSGEDAVPEVTEKVKEVMNAKQEAKLDIIFDDLPNVITESQEGTERVRKIVADLKSFSRVDDAKLQHADINEGLESTLGIVWNELKYKANLKKEYGDIPQILCYPGQHNQVFLNLLVNAAQAIEEKGEICIRTFAQAEQLCVEITDTGKGIPEEEISRLFEPFFTTKPVGQGTGLGLSIAYEIINKHGGTIEVKSKLGEGTAFTIRLPLKGIEDE